MLSEGLHIPASCSSHKMSVKGGTRVHRSSRVIFAIALVCLSNSAQAREPTEGASLWTGCTADFFSPAYYERYAACRAYVIGIADVLTAGDSVAGRKACIPKAASKADITEKVVAWLEASPDRRNDALAHALVAEAISTGAHRAGV